MIGWPRTSGRWVWQMDGERGMLWTEFTFLPKGKKESRLGLQTLQKGRERALKYENRRLRGPKRSSAIWLGCQGFFHLNRSGRINWIVLLHSIQSEGGRNRSSITCPGRSALVERYSAFHRWEMNIEPCNAKSAIRQKQALGGCMRALPGRIDWEGKALLAELVAHSGENSEMRRPKG